MRAAAVQVRCDLCGLSSDSVGVGAFEQHRGFDFCRWCCWLGGRSIESGGHTVTLARGTWHCSCDQVAGDVIERLRQHGVRLAAMDAVPGGIVAATASLHVETPNWPRSY